MCVQTLFYADSVVWYSTVVTDRHVIVILRHKQLSHTDRGSTQATSNNSNDPEPAHPNDPQSHSEGVITFATAIIPLSGRAVPTRVILTLVPLPLYLGTGQV